jgi:hypothetical protein
MSSIPEKGSSTDTERSLNDQDVLARLGYKEEFKRDFSRFELAGLSFSIVGVVTGIACVFIPGFLTFDELIYLIAERYFCTQFPMAVLSA